MDREPPGRTDIEQTAKQVLHTRHIRSVMLVLVLFAFGALLYAMTIVKLVG